MQTKIRNLYLKEIVIFGKIYKADNKFNNISDNFSFKIITFFNKCR